MSQSTSFGPAERVRAFGYFVIAGIYFSFAQLVASRAAHGLSSGDWSQPVERAILLFLLLVGFGAMGRAFEHQHRPLRAMGLVLRPGASREFGLGAALGWGMVIVSILPMVFSGGLIVSFWTSPHQFGLLFLDLLTLALASLAEEVAFRGYPFQRLIEAIGPTLATLLLSALFGLAHVLNPSATSTSVIITVFAGWLLSIAYLRTRALWFSWGWHFAWNISISVLFGLPLSGLRNLSPIIQSNTIGARWMTGGEYGPEGSLVAAGVLLVGVIAVFRITRGYAYKYAQPEIVSAGMPIDLDALGRAGTPDHPPESSAGEKLVQINSISGSNPGAGVSSQPGVESTPPTGSVSPLPAPESAAVPESTEDRGAGTSPDPCAGEG